MPAGRHRKSPDSLNPRPEQLPPGGARRGHEERIVAQPDSEAIPSPNGLARRHARYNLLMKPATLGVIVVLLVVACGRTAPHAQSGAGPALVGTWLLTSEQMHADSDKPTAAQGARGA